MRSTPPVRITAPAARLAASLALTLTALIAGSFCARASAQPDGERRAPAAQETPRIESSTVRLGTNEGTLVLTIDGDQVDARLNGKPIDADRLIIAEDQISVRDAAGGLMFVFDRLAPPGAAPARPVIGVTTAPVPDALAAHLGIEPAGVMLIRSIIPGMPAEEAGVKPWDVVTRINGEPPATIETLRRALADAEDDAPVVLTILRGGETLTLPVRARAVAPTVHPLRNGDGAAARFEFRPAPAHRGPHRLSEEIRDRMRQAREHAEIAQTLQLQLERVERQLSMDEEARAKLAEGMRRAAQSLHELELDIELPEISIVRQGDSDIALFPRGARIERPVIERDVARRVHNLEARIDRLESLLERLVNQLIPPEQEQNNDPSSGV